MTPSRPIQVGTIEGDVDKLLALYTLGYGDCMSQLDRLRVYLTK